MVRVNRRRASYRRGVLLVTQRIAAMPLWKLLLGYLVLFVVTLLVTVGPLARTVLVHSPADFIDAVLGEPTL
jgi:hypothetical protein